MLDVAKQLQRKKKEARPCICIQLLVYSPKDLKRIWRIRRGYISMSYYDKRTYLPAELYKKPYFM